MYPYSIYRKYSKSTTYPPGKETHFEVRASLKCFAEGRGGSKEEGISRYIVYFVLKH